MSPATSKISRATVQDGLHKGTVTDAPISGGDLPRKKSRFLESKRHITRDGVTTNTGPPYLLSRWRGTARAVDYLENFLF